MISENQYPAGDERNSKGAWLEIRLPFLSPAQTEGLHELLRDSAEIEAHHGFGTPVMRCVDSSGQLLGNVIYVRRAAEGAHG